MAIDAAKLDGFSGQVVGDLAAAFSGVMVNIGHKLGLYRAMAGAGPVTSAALAARTGLNERYVREWLNNQAAGGYVGYDAAEKTYLLPDEHALVLAECESAAYMAQAFDAASSIWKSMDRTVAAFRNGDGIGWHEHDAGVFCGIESFFRPGYRANLTSKWIPALDGVEKKLRIGANVADVGCGHGASTIVMAEAYPNSTFYGFDYHTASIETARQRARDIGMGHRVAFEVTDAQGYSPVGYDLICFMDCLHDLGDPVAAARHAREALAPDGTVLLVEPFAADAVEDNLNPVGRLYYALSTTLCTPNALSQNGGDALGAQAGEARLTEVMREAGFGSVRRVAETAFNIVLEVRP